MISTHLDLYKNVHSDIDIYHLKEKKPKHLKSTYLLNYLDKINQKKKQFENAII
jgi:hypothetical protein